jgi:colicin import membrane protein
VQGYINGIRSKVRSRYVPPADIANTLEAEFTVMLLPGGELRDVIKRRSSGNPAYDAAVEKAIRNAQPFAVPSGADFQYFAQFPMTFRLQ